MTMWTLSLIASVTVLWVGMLGAVAYLAAQKVPTRTHGRINS